MAVQASQTPTLVSDNEAHTLPSEPDWPPRSFPPDTLIRNFGLAVGLCGIGATGLLWFWQAQGPLELLGRLIGGIALIGVAGIGWEMIRWLRTPLQRPRDEVDPWEAGPLAFLPDQEPSITVLINAVDVWGSNLQATLEALEQQERIKPEVWILKAPDRKIEGLPENLPDHLHVCSTNHWAQKMGEFTESLDSQYLALLEAGDVPHPRWLAHSLAYLIRKNREGVFGPGQPDPTTPQGWMSYGLRAFFPLGVVARRQAHRKTLLIEPTFSIIKRTTLQQAYHATCPLKRSITWWDLSVGLARQNAEMTLFNRPLGTRRSSRSGQELAQNMLREGIQLLEAFQASSQQRSIVGGLRRDLWSRVGLTIWPLLALGAITGVLLSGSWWMFLIGGVGSVWFLYAWTQLLEATAGPHPHARRRVVELLVMTGMALMGLTTLADPHIPSESPRIF